MIGDIKKFRFWCQKVLPLVYDNSLSYYEVLCKVVQYLNGLIDDVNKIPDYIDSKIEEALTDEHIIELLSQFIVKIQNAISANNEGTNTNSSKDYNAGQMLWLNDTLYRVIRPISAGATFIVDTNIEAVDFETLFNDFVDEVKHDITANDDDTSATATQNWTTGQWLWLNDVLYEVISDITQGNAYVFSGANANVREITIEEMLNNETTARADADTALQTAIEDEATARADADTALQTAIDNIKVSFSNVNAMLASEKITNGECYRCDGYYESGDKGFGFWLASSVADSDFSIASDNGLYLTPISINGKLNIYQFGAHGNDVDDDHAIIQNAFNYCCTHKIALFIDEGTFALHEVITISQRQFTIIGAGIERTNLHRVTSEGLYNYIFRFTGSLQWGLSISDMSLYNDGGGACIYFSDGTSGGDVYHAQFRNLQLLNSAYGFMIPDGATTTPWWGTEFDNIIFSRITIQCIHMGGSSVGIPNNSYRHITTYSCGSNGGANAQFYLKGYNQVLENFEILSAYQPLLHLLSGCNAVINAFKCENLQQNTVNHPLIKLEDYAMIKATEMSFAGDYTKVSALFAYSGTEWASFDIDILRIGIRAGTSMAVAQICSTPNIKGSIGEIFNIISSNPLPYSWSNDINVTLKSLNNNKCTGISSDTIIDPLIVSKVRSSASCTLTVNITSDDRNRYASNLDIIISAVSTNTITVVLGGDTIGTVTNATKHLIVQGGYGYLI